MGKKEDKQYKRIQYRAPEYLVVAARKKYGKDIFVLGATPDDLLNFWSLFQKNAVSMEMPEEVGRTVVDIDAKSHINTSQGDPDNKEPWDDFKITSSSSKSQTKTSSTSYQMQFSQQKKTSVGANLNFKISGPSFFNLASGGLTAAREKTTTETSPTTQEEKKEQALSQSYDIVEALKVPARTKVRAVIRTYAVTHKAKTVVKFSVDAKATLPVAFRTDASRRFFGGRFVTNGFLKIEEMFKNEDKAQIVDDIMTFERSAYMSYLSEEVEVTKQTLPINN